MTVFSFSDLALEIAGNTYTGEYLADVTISKAVDGIGTSGISTSQLSAKVLTDYRFPQGSSVKVTYKGWEFPTYYIDNPEYDGTAMSFTAYDRCKDLDIPFDCTNYPQYAPKQKEDGDTTSGSSSSSGSNGGRSSTTTGTDSGSTSSGSSTSTGSSGSTSSDGSTVVKKTTTSTKPEAKYLASQIVQHISALVGFSKCNYAPQTLYLTNSELKDKSCREILQEITAADCGVAYCGNDNSLRFVSATGSGSGASVKKGEYSKIIEKSQKTYTRFLIEDSKNNKYYDYGSGDYSHCLMLSGALLNEAVSQQIASKLGLEYLAFSIDSAEISSNLEIFGQIFIPDCETKYICRNITISFTATSAIASLSSPQRSESKSEYYNWLKRANDGKVKLNTTYNTFFVNKNGSGHRIKI